MSTRRSGHRPLRTSATVGVVALAVAAGTAAVTAGGAATGAVDPTAGLLASYELDQTSGTVVEDSSGHDRDAAVVGSQGWSATGEDGFTFTGGGNSSGNGIRLPDDLLKGQDQVTVDMDVWVDPTLSGNWFLFNLGNYTSYPNGSGYLFVTGEDAQGQYRGTIAESGYASEQRISRAGALAKGTWKRVTFTVDGGTVADPGEAKLYEDGRLVASSAVTTSPARLGEPDGSTVANWLGRSAYRNDLSFEGRMRDVSIWSTALTEQQVAQGSCFGAADAASAVVVPNADDVRGNITLPAEGPFGSTLTWASSDPAVVTTTGEVTRPATGSAAKKVDLTVTATLGGRSATRTIPLTIRPAPAALDPEGYAFAYFTGEGAGGERIFMAGSQGDQPLAYDVLNKGEPILTSTLGERGVRDPFLLRSHEGDRFFLLATDLKIDGRGGNGFATAQENGSKSLMVWESTDLVTWSAQREVKVSSDFAGNTWAPEAYYDEAAGEYVVYWASALYPTPATGEHAIGNSYQRMVYVTTRDFTTFSEPRIWIDVSRGSGRGMIDATVVRDGGTFYRVVKDEASMTVRQEVSPSLRATVTGSLPTTTSPESGWRLVKEQIGVGQPNPWGGTFTNGEGPTVFRDNDVANRWYLLVDQPSYHGGQGYLAFTTDSLATADWRSVPEAKLPASPRHGTVVPVSAAELAAMRTAYQGGPAKQASAPAVSWPTSGTGCGTEPTTDPTTDPTTSPTTSPTQSTSPTQLPASPQVSPTQAAAPTVSLTAPRRLTTSKRAKVTLTLSASAAGNRTVTLTLKKGKRTVVTRQVVVSGSTATLKLPRLTRAGRYTLTATYADAAGSGSDAVTLRVKGKRR
ncbi:immunoglobulin-like domain-containing protein [Nocardioides flavescens]|uniref:Family 43 glycosylhydrolase n=1 Tax=Nocardioides flavescens TaxID=2691959 RepID=A0A6L7F1Q5_9ACTN|nr:family 43 glycosylhydrolase [Nocardioides flavescens]